MLSRATLAFGLGLTASLGVGVRAATTCNGYSDLCSKSYGAVTFVGAHDSYSVGTNIVNNQYNDVTQQLNDGIRTLQVQAHNASDGIHLCHSSCSLYDGGTLESYLSSVTTWVAANPNDVVTIVMVNIDDLPPTDFATDFVSAGLDQYAYSPSSASLSVSDWPTLGDMIDSGKRVVVFMDTEADITSVSYIVDEFSNMFEDAYDVTDQTWSCNVNRTSGTASSQLMLINHFLDSVYNLAGTVFYIPNTELLNETNAESGTGSIGAHVTNCQSIWGRNPNHILLDYYNSNGNDPFDAAASMNGVSDPTNSVATPTATATGASGTSGTSSSSSGSSAQISSSSLNGARSSVDGSRAGLLALVGTTVLGVVMGWAVL